MNDRWRAAVSPAARALCLFALFAVASAGCGGGDSGTSDAAGSQAAAPSKTSTPASDDGGANGDKPKKGAWGVAFGAEGSLGPIVYDQSGHTLYTFSKDRGTTSTCYGACAKTWPPALTEGKPRAGGSASPAKVGATKRRDGTVQLTYAGHPLYRYSRDKSSEINGNGVESFGGRWHAIRPNGRRP